MHLDAKQIQRSLIFFKFLKSRPQEYFKTSVIKPCGACKGTGLSGIHGTSNDYSWDNYSYCDECHGVGYIGLAGGIQIDDVHFICKKCNGIGCKHCNNGITDWIAHAMG
jgi:DnaJ-class molecular chaperone